MRVVDMTGRTVGNLYVSGRAPRQKFGASTAAMWYCECKCGNTCIVSGQSLRRQLTRSCGCLRSEIVRARNTRKQHVLTLSE